jgi:hypothetical protein
MRFSNSIGGDVAAKLNASSAASRFVTKALGTPMPAAVCACWVAAASHSDRCYNESAQLHTRQRTSAYATTRDEIQLSSPGIGVKMT